MEKRLRNAAATRDAILRSAIAAFARHGYDGAGVREIAAGAGVTAMLVNRYFGSKEQLFAEASAATLEQPVILSADTVASSAPWDDIARKLVEITDPGSDALTGFQIMLRSASSDRAAQIGREQIENHHQQTMQRLIRRDPVPERAALALAIVAGVQLLRQTMGLDALAKADPETLERLIAPLFRQLIEGDATN